MVRRKPVIVEMVSAYLFDRRQGKGVGDWALALHELKEDQILWIDMVDGSDTPKDEARNVLDALDLGAAAELKLGDPDRRPGVEQFDKHLRVTAVAVSDAEHDPARERIVVDCLLGSNWILTVHGAWSILPSRFRSLSPFNAPAASFVRPFASSTFVMSPPLC
jgi:Mg2+ and Co2+ transporter CorA